MMPSDRIAPVDWLSRQRRLEGWPPISRDLMNVLIRLYNAKLDDTPFVNLDDVHHRTLRWLQRQDFIFASKGPDGVRYKITDRGERTMKAYLRPPKRHDDICPTCGENPKHVTAGGKKVGYCAECYRVYRRNMAGRYTSRSRPGRMCSTCGKRPCHRHPGGKYSTYCTECNRKRKRTEKAQRVARLRQRIDSGDVPTCQRPGCSAPIYFTANTVYEVCHEHYRMYQTQYRDRRRPDSHAARRRRYQRNDGKRSER